jgi:hypothetical protein
LVIFTQPATRTYTLEGKEGRAAETVKPIRAALDWQGPIGAGRNLSFATIVLEHRRSMAAPLNFAD